MSPITRAAVEAMDARDPLAGCRAWFALPAGVDLPRRQLAGRASASRPPSVSGRSWRRGGEISSAAGTATTGSAGRGAWVTGSRDSSARGPGEVIVADSTSVNVFKLLAAALDLNRERRVILSETDNFPTDLHVAQGLAHLLGDAVELRTVEATALLGALGRDVAVLMLTHVNYRTGAMHDMAALTAAAHEAGALVLWDLSHSAGAMPLALNDGRRRSGRRRRLQVPQRRAGRAGVRVRGRALARADPARALRVDGSRAAVRLRRDVTSPRRGSSGCWPARRPCCRWPRSTPASRPFDGVDLGLVRAKSVALGALFRRLVEQECDGLGLRARLARRPRALREPGVLRAPRRLRDHAGADRRRRHR